jgi:predicted ester cyclase
MSTPQEAKEVIRRWNNEGWSGGKYELAHEIISPNMTVHGAGGQAVGMGPDGLIDLIKTWRTAFPDGRMAIDDIIVEGDIVAIRNTWHGTHEAEFYGVPPSGAAVAVTSVGIDRVVDGLVTEGWGELDMVGMMQQMGALPLVGPGAVAAGRS